MEFGLMYYKGNGVAQALREAVRWFRMAAQQGDPDAQRFLLRLSEAISQDYLFLN